MALRNEYNSVSSFVILKFYTKIITSIEENGWEMHIHWWEKVLIKMLNMFTQLVWTHQKYVLDSGVRCYMKFINPKWNSAIHEIIILIHKHMCAENL